VSDYSGRRSGRTRDRSTPPSRRSNADPTAVQPVPPDGAGEPVPICSTRSLDPAGTTVGFMWCSLPHGELQSCLRPNSPGRFPEPFRSGGRGVPVLVPASASPDFARRRRPPSGSAVPRAAAYFSRAWARRPCSRARPAQPAMAGRAFAPERTSRCRLRAGLESPALTTVFQFAMDREFQPESKLSPDLGQRWVWLAPIVAHVVFGGQLRGACQWRRERSSLPSTTRRQSMSRRQQSASTNMPSFAS